MSVALAPARPSVLARGVPPAPLTLILLTLLTRLPLQSRFLYHWDSINFAFAIRTFDIAQGQPHAPGYLLYVLLGRAAAALTGSAQSGYVALSILGTALASWALYDLGTRLWNARVGWTAALLLLFSPLFWFYGEVALPHTLDALMVIVAAGLAWRVGQGETRCATRLAVWLGLAGALREQTLVFMLPLALVCCRRLDRRAMGVSAAILVAATLAWLIPLVEMTGGWRRYESIVSAYSYAFDRSTSVFLGAGGAGLRHNAWKLFAYTLWAWGFGLVPLVRSLPALRRRRAASWRHSPRVRLLALWAAPSLFFYVFIHMGQQGLIFVYLPVCLLLSAYAADALVRLRLGSPWEAAACVVGNALLFLFLPSHPLPAGGLKVLSVATIREHDTEVQSEMEDVRADLPPGTLLLSENWRFPQYYLPQVPLIHYSPVTSDDAGAATPIDPDTARLVRSAASLAWYEPDLDGLNRSPAAVSVRPPHHGVRLRVLRRPPGGALWITPSGFGVTKG